MPKASLALVDARTVRAAYLDLRTREGFRVADHTVDADSATSRACVTLLRAAGQARRRLHPYVSLNGEAPKALEATGSQICVEGLDHGQRYKLSLRCACRRRFSTNCWNRMSISTSIFPIVPPWCASPATACVAVHRAPRHPDRFGQYLERQPETLPGRRPRHRPPMTSSQFSPSSTATAPTASRTKAEELACSIDDAGNHYEVVTSSRSTAWPLKRKPGVYAICRKPAYPASPTGGTAGATQWFFVDIGLATYSGSDGLNAFLPACWRARSRSAA